jgi:hypothetical protein
MTENQFTTEELAALNKEYQTIRRVIDSLLSSNPMLRGIQLHSVRFEAKPVTQTESDLVVQINTNITPEVVGGCCMCRTPAGGCGIFCGINDCSEIGLSPC